MPALLLALIHPSAWKGYRRCVNFHVLLHWARMLRWRAWGEEEQAYAIRRFGGNKNLLR